MVKKTKVRREDLKIGTCWLKDSFWRVIYDIEGYSSTGLPINICWGDRYGPGICSHKTMLDWIRDGAREVSADEEFWQNMDDKDRVIMFQWLEFGSSKRKSYT